LKAASATHLIDFRLALLEEVNRLVDGGLFGGLDPLVGDGFHLRGYALRSKSPADYFGIHIHTFVFFTDSVRLQY